MRRWPLVQQITEWDRAISRRWRQVGQGRARRWAVLGAHLGDGWVWVLLLLLMLLLLPSTRRPWVWRWAISMAVAGGITTSLKFLWRRQRPSQIGGFYSQDYDRHSFPSGHATRMGTVVVYMPLLLSRWGWLSLPIALWVGWSRVVLGVHYLLDIVVGMALGIVVSLVVLVV